MAVVQGVVLMAGTCVAASLSSEEHIAAALNMADGAAVTNALEKARENVVTRQGKKGRKIVFSNPKDLFDLSDHYAAVSYNAKILPDTKAIVVMLFERSEASLTSPKSYPYLLFKGKGDLAAYAGMDEALLCKYFRDMGISDCVPVFTQRKWKQLLAQKADRVHTHDINSLTGTLSADRIDDSITRDAELKAALAAKADLTMVHTSVTPSVSLPSADVTLLQQRVLALEAQIARLNRLLAGISRKGGNLTMEGMNVILTNGSGTTDTTNGTGNLIVGYNAADAVTGSHNIVVGNGNQCGAYGAVVSGEDHRIRGRYPAAVGGRKNTVTGNFAFAAGGEGNKADGKLSAVIGGKKNHAGGEMAIISGGQKRSVLNQNPHFTGN